MGMQVNLNAVVADPFELRLENKVVLGTFEVVDANSLTLFLKLGYKIENEKDLPIVYQLLEQKFIAGKGDGEACCLKALEMRVSYLNEHGKEEKASHLPLEDKKKGFSTITQKQLMALISNLFFELLMQRFAKFYPNIKLQEKNFAEEEESLVWTCASFNLERFNEVRLLPSKSVPTAEKINYTLVNESLIRE